MIFDKLRAVAPEAGCRFSDYSGAEVDLDGGDAAARSKNLRRRKTEIRRIKPVSDGKSGDLVAFPDRNGCIGKKKRSDVQREIKLMEEALLVESLGNDVEAAGVEHGAASIIGRRREMEDAVAAELGLVKRGGRCYDFFGVYDGHGGWRVARDCSEMLHNFVAEIAAGGDSSGEVAWERVMAAGFRKMDEEVNKSGAAVASTGSTAVVALVGEEEIVVANCGDSRAVLSRGGVAVQMSDDHKPDRADELERIEGCGGKVINWNGNRVLGVLATSRSIGDDYLKPYVITDPEVKVVKRTKSDEFLILASDGLWDVISNELACRVARRCLEGRLRKSSSAVSSGCTRGGRAAEAAAVLAKLAMARGSYDNISVIVVDLRSNNSSLDQTADISC